MAEIQCPMCGKSNPDHLDICQFCEARLKPLIISSPEEETIDDLGKGKDFDSEVILSPENSEDDNSWLNQMRSAAENQDSSTWSPEDDSPLEESDSTLAAGDEWLQRIRALHQNDQGADLEPPPEEETQADTPPEPSPVMDSLGEADTARPGWVNRQNDEPGSGNQIEDADINGKEELPDWLKNAVSAADQDTPNDAETEEPLPSWLTAGFDTQEDDRPALESDEAVQGLITSLEGEDTLQDTLPSVDHEGPLTQDDPSDTADWLPQSLNGEAEATPPDTDQEMEDVDWLPDDVIGDLGVSSIPAVPNGSDPKQDWLSDLDSEEAKAESLFQSQDEEIPDWLSEIGISTEPSTTETGEPGPDLLSDPPRDEPGVTPTTQGEGEEIPDRAGDTVSSDMDIDVGMRAASYEYTEGDSEGLLQSEEPEDIPLYERPGDQTPEWLNGLSTEGELDETSIPYPDPGDEPVLAGEEDLQSWFSELDEDSEPETSGTVSETDPEIPGWLKSLGSVVTGTVDDNNIPKVIEGDATPFVGQDEFDDDLLDVESLPSWLEPESAAPEVKKEGGGSDLAHAEIPGWLEAMRPVEGDSSGTSLEDAPVERAGPLAGLRAVLPAEPEIIHYKKPPVYSSKLKVTDSHLAQADILKRLLSPEGEKSPVPEPPLVSSQRAFRWLTAIILSIVIGFVVIGGSQFVPLPGTHAIPDATYNASKIISALPNQAPVLIAFDFEPGNAGEMNAAAAALVDHLMLKAARLTLVSTLPTGPAVAEYFIQSVQHQHGYTSGIQYINLGYIPGGSTGLLSFTQTPKWVFPLSYDGFYPWETQTLEGVDTLSDFSLVVVITHDSDTARSWIEQVEPRINDTPLLTVVSAQAEPLVRPYYSNEPDSQVNGIVSGLSGGAAYEVAVGRTNLGRTYWDAFGVSLVIAVGAILVGGGVNGIQFVLAQFRKGKRGEGK